MLSIGRYLEPKTELAMMDFSHGSIPKTAEHEEHLPASCIVIRQKAATKLRGLVLDGGRVDDRHSIHRLGFLANIGVEILRSKLELRREILFGKRGFKPSSRFSNHIESWLFSRISEVYENLDFLTGRQPSIQTYVGWRYPRALLPMKVVDSGLKRLLRLSLRRNASCVHFLGLDLKFPYGVVYSAINLEGAAGETLRSSRVLSSIRGADFGSGNQFIGLLGGLFRTALKHADLNNGCSGVEHCSEGHQDATKNEGSIVKRGLSPSLPNVHIIASLMRVVGVLVSSCFLVFDIVFPGEKLRRFLRNVALILLGVICFVAMFYS
ncbi:MAG: hypothetical protein WBX18_10545, partial [Terracidiphilus sp.]